MTLVYELHLNPKFYKPVLSSVGLKTLDIMQGSEAAPQPRISLSFKPACEQKKKFFKEGLSTKETVFYIQLNFIVIK